MTPPIDASAPKTLAAGLLFLALAATGWGALRHSAQMYGGMPMPGDPGAFFLSGLCITIVAIAGVILMALGFWLCLTTGHRFIAADRLIRGLRDWALASGFVVSLLAMPLAMRSLGTPYAVAVFSTLWVFILLTVVRGWSWRHAPEAALFGAGAAVVIHVVFIRLLNLPLPS